MTTHKIVICERYGGFGISRQAWDRLNELGANRGEWDGFGHGHDLDRTDPRLIAVVEELGSEAASGYYARLVVKTFEGEKYRIREYDGFEWLETPDSIEWSTVNGPR